MKRQCVPSPVMWSVFAAVIFASQCIASPAFAATPMESILCEVLAYLNGNLGRASGTLAIIMLGVASALGKASWGLAITITVGIGILFGATNIVQTFTGISVC